MAKRTWEFRDKEEFWLAQLYLHRKFKSDLHYLEHREAEKARNEFFAAKHPEALTAWIHQWLLPEQIKRLRTYLRVERSRSKKHRQNITIDGEVRARLADYAKRNNVTLSEAIAKLLDQFDQGDEQGRLW